MFGFGKNASVKIDKDLFTRLTKVADVAGYATVDEFVAHVLEKEMLHFEDSKNDDEIRAKLKGLGYIS
jgi:hypothetical protein